MKQSLITDFVQKITDSYVSQLDNLHNENKENRQALESKLNDGHNTRIEELERKHAEVRRNIEAQFSIDRVNLEKMRESELKETFADINNRIAIKTTEINNASIEKLKEVKGIAILLGVDVTIIPKDLPSYMSPQDRQIQSDAEFVSNLLKREKEELEMKKKSSKKDGKVAIEISNQSDSDFITVSKKGSKRINYSQLFTPPAPVVPGDTHKCIGTGCGCDFTVTHQEKEFYILKNLAVPSHCQDCRIKKKAIDEEQLAASSIEYKTIELSCIRCKKGFPFSAIDQLNFAKNEWPNPKNCKNCKKNKK